MVDKEKFRKKVVGLFTGQEFTIRKVRLNEYLREIGTIPMGIDGSVAEALTKVSDSLRAKSGDPEAEQRTMRFFLSRGIVPTNETPGIWLEDEKDCPENFIPVADLGSDADWLVGEIAQFSFEMGGLAQMGRFFRGPGAVDPGPGGEEVRAEAVGDAPAGDVPDGAGHA